MVRLGAATQRVIFAILAASSKAGGKRRTAAAAMRRVLTRLKKDDLVWLTDTDALPICYVGAAGCDFAPAGWDGADIK